MKATEARAITNVQQQIYLTQAKEEILKQIAAQASGGWNFLEYHHVGHLLEESIRQLRAFLREKGYTTGHSRHDGQIIRIWW